MNDLKSLAAMTALNDMFSKGYMSICTIDRIGKMLDRNPRCDAYEILHSLHCVHFDRMPKELRDSIPDLIRQCLDVEPIYRFEPAVAALLRVMGEHATRLLKRLFS